jgi:HPt (histidine-containing phosphotransfer) domain-containing protein
MFSICDDINQTDLLRSWVEELTGFTPQQVEQVIEQLQEQGNDALASAA